MVTTNPTGKAILQASLELFRQDRQMIWLPVMATAISLVAFALIAVPIGVLGDGGIALVVALACGTLVATASAIFFNVALVFAATDRIEGRTPTIGGSLALAWGRRGVILRWALLAAVVGTAIRMLETRLGVLGRVLGFAGGLAWAVATFIVVPVLAFEDLGPIEAVKRSSSILKARFGTIARGTLRFGLRFFALSLGAAVVILGGIALIFSHAYLVGVPLAVAGAVLLFGVAMYASAAGMYMRTILYRFATDQPIPDIGVDVARTFTTR